jgi:hypothetical protein
MIASVHPTGTLERARSSWLDPDLTGLSGASHRCLPEKTGLRAPLLILSSDLVVSANAVAEGQRCLTKGYYREPVATPQAHGAARRDRIALHGLGESAATVRASLS